MMAATSRQRRQVAAIALLVAFLAVNTTSARASSWTVTATGTATALARSLDPQPPATVSATCTAPLTDRTITVSWSTVGPATSYVVYQSTTSATTGFSAVATGVTTTTWTSGTLKKGTYWYGVAAVVGSPNWTSPMSDPTAGNTIGTSVRCS